jgi:periplasmic divalent cation tolerance protein
MNEKVFLVYSTCADAAAAARIARTLVEERLAACVSLQSGNRSVYRWEGELQEDSEQLLMIKTSADRLATLTERLAAIHPYELPEIVAGPVTAGLTGYLDWVVGECRDPAVAGRTPSTPQ